MIRLFINFFNNKNVLRVFITTIIGLILSIIVKEYGTLHFTGMDYGVLTSAAYQYFLGYKPYSDIITGTPPVYLILGKISFDLFGVKFASFVYITAIVTFFTFLYLVWVWYKISNSLIKSLIYSLTAEIVIIFTFSTINYNRFSLISATMYILTLIYFIKQKRQLFSSFLLIIQGAILLLVKANIAVSLILFSFIILIRLNNKIKTLIIYTTSFLVFLLLLSFSNINIFNLIKNYLWHGGRAFDPSVWKIFILNGWEVKQTFIFFTPITVILLISLIAVVINKSIFKKCNLQFVYFQIILLSVLIGIIGLITNNDLNFVDGFLILNGIILIPIIYKNILQNTNIYKIYNIVIYATCSFLIIYGLIIGINRVNISEGGPSFFYEYAYYPSEKCLFLSDTKCRQLIIGSTAKLLNLNVQDTGNFRYLVKSKYSFFNSMLIEQNLEETEDEINKVILFFKKNGVNKDKIGFGPRIDFNYATFKIKPPKGPLWWEAFSYVKPDEKLISMVQKYRNNNKLIFIHLKQIYQFYPPLLYGGYIISEHDLVQTSMLDIWFNKQDKQTQKIKEAYKKMLKDEGIEYIESE